MLHWTGQSKKQRRKNNLQMKQQYCVWTELNIFVVSVSCWLMIVNASFFFLEQTKINCTCLQAPFEQLPIWCGPCCQTQLFSQRRGGSLAREHLLWTPRTVVHFSFRKNKLLLLRQRVLVTHQRQSVDRQRLITSGRIHLGTPRLPTTKHLHFVAVDAQPAVCQMFARSQISEAAARERLELYLNVECSGACDDLKQVVPQQEVSDGQKRRK